MDETTAARRRAYQREQKRLWRLANPDESRRRSAEYRKKNPGKVKKTQSQWAAKNRDKVKVYRAKSKLKLIDNPEWRALQRQRQKDWRDANPEKTREKYRRFLVQNPDKRTQYNKRNAETKKRRRGAMTVEQKKAYYQANYQKNKERNLARSREKRTGFSVALVESRLLEQCGLCGICRQGFKPHSNGRTGVCADHCHETGKPRGLLCPPCNKSLGFYEKNQRETLFIQPYEDYLAKHAKL